MVVWGFFSNIPFSRTVASWLRKSRFGFGLPKDVARSAACEATRRRAGVVAVIYHPPTNRSVAPRVVPKAKSVFFLRIARF